MYDPERKDEGGKKKDGGGKRRLVSLGMQKKNSAAAEESKGKKKSKGNPQKAVLTNWKKKSNPEKAQKKRRKKKGGETPLTDLEIVRRRPSLVQKSPSFVEKKQGARRPGKKNDNPFEEERKRKVGGVRLEKKGKKKSQTIPQKWGSALEKEGPPLQKGKKRYPSSQEKKKGKVIIFFPQKC